VKLRDGVASYDAGATLLYDSIPEAEDRECWLKATGFLRALKAEAAAPEVYAPRKEKAPACVSF